MQKFGKKITTLSIKLGRFVAIPLFLSLAFLAHTMGDTLLLVVSMIVLGSAIGIPLAIAAGLLLLDDERAVIKEHLDKNDEEMARLVRRFGPK